MLEKIQSLLNDQSIKQLETIQSLWSGYGSIVRYVSQTHQRSIIVKQIKTDHKNDNHPRGWNTSTSHQRKLKSYQVELAFYQNYAKYTSALCKVPNLLACEQQPNGYLLLLQDLDAAGFAVRKKTGDWPTVKLGIHWLANFHAQFLNCHANDLWQQGGYWHLATRQDEYQVMPESPLKQAAHVLDNELQQAKYQTLLHGDAKLENMCFNMAGDKVAAVDFQYVGKGAGIIDLAYFAGSALQQQQLIHHHDEILDEYLSQLALALKNQGHELDFAELTAEYRRLYPIAWADFHRFLTGWNPASWKINPYMLQQTKNALTSLKQL